MNAQYPRDYVKVLSEGLKIIDGPDRITSDHDFYGTLLMAFQSQTSPPHLGTMEGLSIYGNLNDPLQDTCLIRHVVWDVASTRNSILHAWKQGHSLPKSDAPKVEEKRIGVASVAGVYDSLFKLVFDLQVVNRQPTFEIRKLRFRFETVLTFEFSWFYDTETPTDIDRFWSRSIHEMKDLK